MPAPVKPDHEKRSYSLPSIRCNVSEYSAIQRNAKKANKSVSRFVRELAAGQQNVVPQIKDANDNIPELDPKREIALQLIRLGNNLNQLAKTANTYGAMPQNLPALISNISDYLDKNIFENDSED